MRRRLIDTTMLTLVAALVLSALPTLTADAQTRRPRRRPPATTLVPAGTQLRVRLNDTISSKESRAGDRFTATVVNPSRYEEGKVTGHIRSIRKSGRVQGRTTMSLAFDSVRLKDGRTGTMRAEVLRVYDSDSANNVDEEGRVQSGSRGKQTLKRSGIGAVAGAVIGGIAGGRKGAAIGMIVGGAAGAGSIAVDGSKELKIERGTEILLRVNSR
jgi:outer membrane lipoprotein SlyB